jgi:hypothetical protein
VCMQNLSFPPSSDMPITENLYQFSVLSGSDQGRLWGTESVRQTSLDTTIFFEVKKKKEFIIFVGTQVQSCLGSYFRV